MPEQPVRLQKYLSSCGVCSRRAAEVLIVDGQVAVNGEVVTKLGTKVSPGVDVVLVDGQRVKCQQKMLFRFYKPRGIVTTMKDEKGRPCVGDLVEKLPVSVCPIGRLDFDVSGLLLLTSDGDYAQNLSHPNNQVQRVYWAKVAGIVDHDSVDQLLQGVVLGTGLGKAKSAKMIKQSRRTQSLLGMVVAGESLVEVCVTEGRNHFVKDILSAVQHPVLRLCRVRFGAYELGNMSPCELREVSDYS